jgi:polysaccharide export outer membrane protein
VRPAETQPRKRPLEFIRMTLFRLRTAASLGAVVLSCVTFTPAAAQSGDMGGRTFNTPVYAPAQAASASDNGRSGTSRSTEGQGGLDARNSDPRDTSGANSHDGQRDDRNTQRGSRENERPRQRPLQPSAFQKFVEVATGRQLPVFGSSFFEDAADSFSPVDNVPVSADYTVGSGDEVMVRAWGSIDVDYRARVDRNGQINLPKVGSFTVAGVKASDLERHLRAQIGRLYTNFNLNVTLGQLRGVKVFVVGPARLPGVYTLSSQSTVLSAVVAAGGPGPNGSMRKVQLRRDGKVVSEIDMYEFLVQGDKSKDQQLTAGDVVVFLPVGPRVALNGAVESPAIYELKTPQEPLGDVLRYAGGQPVLANPNRVHLERIDPSKQPAARFIEDFKLDTAGQQKTLRDGDVLTLLAISPQFSNEVTLKGHVAQPLRYPYTPGMKVRDLIPNKDALISPDFYRRKNLLVQIQEDEDDLWTDPRYSRDARDKRDSRGTPEGRGRQTTDDTRRRSDGTERRTGTLSTPDQLNSRSGRLREGSNLRSDDAEFIERARTPAALFDEINWDYAVIERLNETDLSTQVISFNLGKAVLSADPEQNLDLKPGDVVTVYSQRDVKVPVSRQTRLVSIEGEVGAPGVYQLRPGETLQQLIVRAGGFTPQAYVYGLELTREETRKRQRENLASAIARLEALSATQAARDSANFREINSAQANASANNAQLSRLNRLQPNGRIALELDPNVKADSELPLLTLENADRIVVPTRPGFISVAGAVVNSNSFLWKSDRSAGDYLDVAGMDETADKSNVFILRADGTVDHAHNRRGFLGFGGIESAKLNPGDAIIVPSQVDFETWGRALVRNLKDWSQIFSQFGLGIAAIHTLNRD